MHPIGLLSGGIPTKLSIHVLLQEGRKVPHMREILDMAEIVVSFEHLSQPHAAHAARGGAGGQSACVCVGRDGDMGMAAINK